jgi:23S rRNA (pseudouridine1915-N3)-methyltransferase
MKIQIIVFGKTAKKFFQESEKFYGERISPFAKVEYIVLSEEKISKTIHGENLKNREAEKFFKVFSEKSSKNFLFACDPAGKNFSSEQFTQKLQNTQLSHSGVTFVIGGALGLSQKILDRADQKISFSPMTFPHDLFRVMLLEQIYRSFMISGNREYHK